MKKITTTITTTTAHKLKNQHEKLKWKKNEQSAEENNICTERL